MHYLYCIFLTTFTLGRICLKFITNLQNSVNKRELRYTIKNKDVLEGWAVTITAQPCRTTLIKSAFLASS